MTTDGLAALTNQREKARTTARRHVPPPRRAPKQDSPTITAPAPDTSPAEPAPPTTPLATNREPIPPTAPVTAPAADTDLIRATIYLGGAADDWLQQVNSHAKAARPRVDASRSAVVRLALERLQDDLSPEQIITVLRTRQATAPERPGRKRL